MDSNNDCNCKEFTHKQQTQTIENVDEAIKPYLKFQDYLYLERIENENQNISNEELLNWQRKKLCFYEKTIAQLLTRLHCCECAYNQVKKRLKNAQAVMDISVSIVNDLTEHKEQFEKLAKVIKRKLTDVSEEHSSDTDVDEDIVETKKYKI